MTTSPKPTKDEALRQAETFIYSSGMAGSGPWTDAAQKTLTAIREALAQPAADDKAGGEAPPEFDVRKIMIGLTAEAAEQREQGQVVEAAWAFANAVWAEMDRLSMPGIYMQLVVQSIVKHYTTPPTPPAGVPDGWQPIETAPKDGSLIVVRGNNHGDEELGQHHCIASWFNGCWTESSDWNATSELTYLTHWMPLPAAQQPEDIPAIFKEQAS